MSNLNGLFKDYNEEKRLHNDIYDKMKEKIEIIIKEIREDDDTLSFSTIYLGSYATRTGVDYKDHAYDIDTGIRLNIKASNIDNHDPNTEKKRVYDAIKGIREKKFRNKCLSATYRENNKPLYHIDFPIYAYDESKETYYLASGNQGEVVWEECEPKKLIEYLTYNDADNAKKDTYKRIVRILKLWKSKVFSDLPKNSCPPSIAINLTVRNYFRSASENDDINHLIAVASILKSQVSDRARLNIPFKPYTDVFYKMNSDSNNVVKYKQKIDELINVLNQAYIKQKESLEETCNILRKILPDFPMPKKQKANESFSPSGAYGK